MTSNVVKSLTDWLTHDVGKTNQTSQKVPLLTPNESIHADDMQYV